tara:strand:+ start:1775 stop:2134 length:360 start_codon:yes stop_codon:yes gene_type:complete
MYLLSVETYLDRYFKCYKDIIIINLFPDGALAELVTKVTMPKLSSFQQNSPCCPTNKCKLSLKSLHNSSSLMCIDEIPDLIEFLTLNNYEIDYNITKLMQESTVKLNQKILFFIKYKKN